MKKILMVLAALAITTVAWAGDRTSYTCVCPKPSCTAYGLKKVSVLFDSERPDEVLLSYADPVAEPPRGDVVLIGARAQRDETENTAYFRELAAIDFKTRERKQVTSTVGSYLKVEKTLISGESRGRIQWVGEKDQGSFALLYLCTSSGN